MTTKKDRISFTFNVVFITAAVLSFFNKPLHLSISLGWVISLSWSFIIAVLVLNRYATKGRARRHTYQLQRMERCKRLINKHGYNFAMRAMGN